MRQKSNVLRITRIVLGVLALGAAASTVAETGTRPLMIEIVGVTPNKGQIMIGVCSKKRFLRPDCDISMMVPAGSQWKQTIELDVPAKGRFAVQVFQDLNNNNVLERNRFGAPREPTGFSNNPKLRFRAPRFEDAAIDLADLSMGKITVNLE